MRTGARAHYPELPGPFTPARVIGGLGTSIIGLDETDGLLLELRPCLSA